MSSDIYAKPDLSKKVRYDRKVQEVDREEMEEREVDIYERADAIGDHRADTPPPGGGPRTEKHPPAVRSRPLRVAAFCLGLLCLLLITGIILLSIRCKIKYSTSQLPNNSVTLEKDQLSNNYSRLQGKVSDISFNHSELQSSYQTLSENHSQLQEEVKQLEGKIEKKWCPEGWRRFGCSCYFKSNKRNTWHGSRDDCQQKGADLVVINNKEEQKFVLELNMDKDSWIGLQARKEIWNQTSWRWQWEWEWVDRSPQTDTMSADVQAPELKVRFSRRDEKNGGEEEEVDIYDPLEQSAPDPRPHEVRPLTDSRPAAVKRRAFGATAAILGVLYLVILVGIYMRNVFVTLEKQNLQTERDQLRIRLDQSETRNIKLTEERDQLQTRYGRFSSETPQNCLI
ncbi:uncharacterized protein LOC142939145 [Anarhichas minor]|uniref:uncharacterized protein LOC142939145 n=1 Tax=Anarhichas minor TaxID=65739 RepID=UPI003F73A2AB